MLNDLFLKYESDKAQHGYADFYEKHLPKRPLSILEIGVKDGASLRAWLEYLPSANIFGLDLFAGNQMPEDLLNNERVKLIKGNQCDWLLLEQLRKYDFDIIIDDGSHNSRDQMITFFGLYNGKQYYIEDIHCCDEDYYRQGLPSSFTAKSVFGEMAGNDLDSFYTGRKVNLSHDHKIVCITG